MVSGELFDRIPCLRKVWIYLNPRLQTQIPGVKLVFLGIMPILCMVLASLLRHCRAWFPSTSQAGEKCWDEILPQYESVSFWVWDKIHQLHTILMEWIRHHGNCIHPAHACPEHWLSIPPWRSFSCWERSQGAKHSLTGPQFPIPREENQAKMLLQTAMPLLDSNNSFTIRAEPQKYSLDKNCQ